VSSGKPDSAYAVRSVPMKVILPEGAGIVQEVVPPLSPTGASSCSLLAAPEADDRLALRKGRPTTLLATLQLHLPQLFLAGQDYSLAFPLVQGVVPPPETEVAWLGACFAGADGWVGVCVCLR
jgi:autophagy-related protein 5